MPGAAFRRLHINSNHSWKRVLWEAATPEHLCLQPTCPHFWKSQVVSLLIGVCLLMQQSKGNSDGDFIVSNRVAGEGYVTSALS